MLVKGDGRKQQRGGGKKRTNPGDGGEGGWVKKRKGGDDEEGGKVQESGIRKRLDALSVGYFRRVGERLTEGFEDDEERGETFLLHICLARPGRI